MRTGRLLCGGKKSQTRSASPNSELRSEYERTTRRILTNKDVGDTSQEESREVDDFEMLASDTC